LLLTREEDVPGAGADASGFCDDGVGDGLGDVGVVLAFGNEQARAGAGSEGDGCHQFGVVAHAVLAVGVGPGPVEDVFAVGVALDVKRHGSDRSAVLRDDEVVRLPAGVGAGAAALLQRQQEFMAQEGAGGVGIRVDQAVPEVDADVGDAGVEVEFVWGWQCGFLGVVVWLRQSPAGQAPTVAVVSFWASRDELSTPGPPPGS